MQSASTVVSCIKMTVSGYILHELIYEGEALSAVRNFCGTGVGAVGQPTLGSWQGLGAAQIVPMELDSFGQPREHPLECCLIVQAGDAMGCDHGRGA
jgi:hypothetical protein